MESQAAGRNKRQASYEFFKKLSKLTIGGAAAFWATTIATSLLPIAAAYRAHFTNWKLQTVWVASLFIGMIIGCCVSYSLLRFMEKNPAKNPIQKSTMLSLIALVIAIILIDVPQSFLLPGSRDGLYYFLIGVIFNAVRFLVLGIVIGNLYKRLYGSANTQAAGMGLQG
jgi:hypothetical protein